MGTRLTMITPDALDVERAADLRAVSI